jgi:uncharacterized protein YcbK (DUF882 family)
MPPMKIRPSSISSKPDHHLTLSRRQFLYGGAVLTAGLALPGSLRAAIAPDDAQQQRLILFNLHTREKLDVCYAQRGAYRPEALAAINNILRDHRANKIHPIDTRLLDLLSAIRSRVGPDACLHIVSGYRSPETNQMLRQRSHRVARKSLHMKGHAADIRIPGVPTKKLRKIAIGLRQGGVGYYPRSRFVHVDIGQVRTW